MVKSLFIGYNISVWLLHHHVTLQKPKKQKQKKLRNKKNVIKNDYLKHGTVKVHKAPQSWLYRLKKKEKKRIQMSQNYTLSIGVHVKCSFVAEFEWFGLFEIM